jgi:hypothetical protein
MLAAKRWPMRSSIPFWMPRKSIEIETMTNKFVDIPIKSLLSWLIHPSYISINKVMGSL